MTRFSASYERVIPVDCDDCGFTGDVAATIEYGQAFWSCPTTRCERNGTDERVSDWVDEEDQ